MRGDAVVCSRISPRMRRLLIPGALLAAALAFPSLAASPSGRCLSLDVPWEITMPDGVTHPAGTLRICHRGEFSPISAAHDIEIAGRTTGRWMAGREWSEARRVDGPVAIFASRRETGLALIGYAWPDDRGGSMVFRLRRGPGPAREGSGPVTVGTAVGWTAVAADVR